MKYFTLALLLCCTSIFAAEKPSIFSPSGVALKGYDVVAYFKLAKAVKGSKKNQFSYKGVKWYFSSSANLALFKKSPEKYQAQYGGYCAYGLGKGGYLAKTDAKAFTLLNGKLYLNYSKGIQKKWDSKKSQLIKNADKAWQEKYSP